MPYTYRPTTYPHAYRWKDEVEAVKKVGAELTGLKFSYNSPAKGLLGSRADGNAVKWVVRSAAEAKDWVLKFNQAFEERGMTFAQARTTRDQFAVRVDVMTEDLR